MWLTGLADCLDTGVMGEGGAQDDDCISALGGEGKGVHLLRSGCKKESRLRVMCSRHLEHADLEGQDRG